MYRKILVPLDGSELAECVFPHIKKVIKDSENTEVILFRVCEPPVLLADYPSDLRPRWEEHVKQEATHAQQQCQLYLDDTGKRLKKAGVNVRMESGLGNPAETIVDYAAKNQVDLIIIASHGRSGIMRWAYGSTADKILRASPVPVMVVKCTSGK
jgi:nucleotide-binding universal stress UspA family protein